MRSSTIVRSVSQLSSTRLQRAHTRTRAPTHASIASKWHFRCATLLTSLSRLSPLCGTTRPPSPRKKRKRFHRNENNGNDDTPFALRPSHPSTPPPRLNPMSRYAHPSPYSRARSILPSLSSSACCRRMPFAGATHQPPPYPTHTQKRTSPVVSPSRLLFCLLALVGSALTNTLRDDPFATTQKTGEAIKRLTHTRGSAPLFALRALHDRSSTAVRRTDKRTCRSLSRH